MKKIFSSVIEIFTFSHRPVWPQTLLVTASNKPHAAVVNGGVLHREPEGESSLVGQVQPVGLVLMPGGLHQTAPLLGDQHVEVELHVGPEEVPGELEDPGVEDRLGYRDLQIQRGPHHLVLKCLVTFVAGSLLNRLLCLLSTQITNTSNI